MYLKRDSLLDSAQQSERHAERVSEAVQCPVLVVGFQRQTAEMTDLGPGIGVADGLIDPCAADFDMREKFAGEHPALVFRHGKDLIGNLGVETLKPCKFLRLGLVEPKERKFERLGERCHEGILAYPAKPCKIQNCTAYISDLKDGALRHILVITFPLKVIFKAVALPTELSQQKRYFTSQDDG